MFELKSPAAWPIHIWKGERRLQQQSGRLKMITWPTAETPDS